VNGQGGISGHQVRVYVDNDADNAATALQDAEDLIQNKHVVAIADGSHVDQAFEKAADDAKVPVIGLTVGQSSSLFETDPNFFANEATVSTSIWAGLETAKLSGSKKMELLYCEEIAACKSAVPIAQTLAAQVGIAVVGAPFSASSPSYTAQCLAAKSAGVDALWAAGTSPTSDQRVYDDCAAQGYQPVAINAGFLGNSAITDPKIPVEWGFMVTLPWFVKDASTATFNQVMGSYLPSAAQPSSVIDTWVGLQEFAAAFTGGGAQSTAQAIYNGLYAFHGETLGGLTAPLTFTQGKPGADKCVFIFKVSNGQYSLPQGPQPVCEG
jgi:branched-chain amino acid transport system substrate-binding protein